MIRCNFVQDYIASTCDNLIIQVFTTSDFDVTHAHTYTECLQKYYKSDN